MNPPPVPAGLPVGVAIVRDGRIEWANERFASALRHDPGTLEGRELLELVAPEEREELAGDSGGSAGGAASRLAGGGWTEVGGLGADGAPYVASLCWERQSDGLLAVAALPSGAPIVVGSAAGSPPTGRPSNAWERASVDGVISHDLRGALRGATSFLTLLDRELGDVLAGRAREHFETARASTVRADLLAERLVHYMRISTRPLHLEPVSLDQIARRAAAQRNQEPALGDLPVEIGELPVVWANPALLTECLAELMTNAWKFSEGRAAVTITASGTRDGWVYVDVADDGPGVDPDLAEAAFAPCRLLQPKGRFAGVGMGLSICRRIAEIHGGRCWIPTSEGTGTVVRIRLARAPAAG